MAAGTWTLNGGGRISLRCQWHCRNWSLTDTVHDVEPRIYVVIRLALLKGPDGVRRRCVVCAIGSVREILSMTDCIKTCRHSRYDHLWKSKGSALVTWVGARKTVYRCARTASDLRPKLGRKPLREPSARRRCQSGYTDAYLQTEYVRAHELQEGDSSARVWRAKSLRNTHVGPLCKGHISNCSSWII